MMTHDQLTVFGGETRVSTGAEATNSVPLSRCRDESKGLRFFVLTRSQIRTCFRRDSEANLRLQLGHKSKRIFGAGMSMKISLIC